MFNMKDYDMMMPQEREFVEDYLMPSTSVGRSEYTDEMIEKTFIPEHFWR